MLVLAAFITPKPEYYELAKEALVNILDATRAETGCAIFWLHESLDKSQLCLYEHFENEDALAQHYDQPYVQSVFESYKTWLAKPVEITKMSMVDGQL